VSRAFTFLSLLLSPSLFGGLSCTSEILGEIISRKALYGGRGSSCPGLNDISLPWLG